MSEEAHRSGPPDAQSVKSGPWREPLARWIDRCGDPGRGTLALDALNAAAEELAIRTASGRGLRFVGAPSGPLPGAQSYEYRIWERGEVLTRLVGRGACHDGFNALCWLAFPQIRAALNALQMRAISPEAGPAAPSLPGGSPVEAAQIRGSASSARGRLRDRVTLFDESGALLVTRDRGLAEALHRADWTGLFLARRECWRSQARLLVVGHALHEKLIRPYKSICARVFVIEADPGDPLGALDAIAAAGIVQAWDAGSRGAGALEPAARALPPLPLLGIPGWCSDNDDPAFYRDPLVFRPPRR